jgi:MFS family permease
MPAARTWLPFGAVETATLLSGAANGVTVVALPWLVLDLTGSATATGGLAAAMAVPTMIAALLAGTLVDRIGRRLVSVGSDILSLISVALIPLLDATIGLTYSMVLALAVAGAVFDPAGAGAREAMLPEAAQSAGLSLPRANSIHEAVWGAAFLVGPGLGGLLIALIGPAGTFWSAAGMFVGSILVIWLVPIPGAGRPDGQGQGGFWEATGEGLRFIWHDRLQRTMGLLLMGLVALYLPIEGVLLPYYFQQQDTPIGLGAVLMVMSAGGIIGALAYGSLARRFTTRTIFVGAMVVTAVLFVPFALLPPLVLVLPLALLIGAGFGPVQPAINVVMQTRTPPRLRGRVVGVLTATAYAAGPFGYLLAGPLVDWISLEGAMIASAAGFVLLAALAVVLPSLREADGIGFASRPPIEDVPPPRPG